MKELTEKPPSPWMGRVALLLAGSALLLVLIEGVLVVGHMWPRFALFSLPHPQNSQRLERKLGLLETDVEHLKAHNQAAKEDVRQKQAQARLEQAQAHLEKEVHDFGDRVESQQRALSALSRSLSHRSQQRQALLILTLGHMRTLIDQGAPYEKALNNAFSLAQGWEGLIPLLKALKPYASSGLPTAATLRAKHPTLPSPSPPGGGTVWQNVWAHMRGWLRVSRTSPSSQPETLEEILKRLKNPPKELRPWVQKVQARLTVDRRMEAINAFVRVHLLQLHPEPVE